MPDTRISSANARQFAAKAHEARRKRKEAETLAAIALPAYPQDNSVVAAQDPYINGLACAQVEYLAKLRKCQVAKDAAALSQTLKNLRETYHMATGLAKPGIRKPERVNTRQQPGQQSSGPELPPDATTGSGSSTQ